MAHTQLFAELAHRGQVTSRETLGEHGVVDPRQVANLPSQGRNWMSLALLAPGTVPPPQGSASTGRGDFALSINGAREDFNGFLLDGVYNIDPKLNTPGVRPPIDELVHGADQRRVAQGGDGGRQAVARPGDGVGLLGGGPHLCGETHQRIRVDRESAHAETLRAADGASGVVHRPAP